MAISAPLYHLLKSIKPLLPAGGSLLELGEANWYGDIDPAILLQEAKQPDVLASVKAAINSRDWFHVAKACYATLFSPAHIVSVDFNGSPASLRLDLNAPLPLNEQFDVVINHGTAEHVFNIGQVFKTMHDRTLAGGLMIHDAPFTGWVDHGFYCLQPTLFYDLAAANCYEIVQVSIYEIKSQKMLRVNRREDVWLLSECNQIPNNAMLFVIYRKIAEQDFKLPLQGYYSNDFSAVGRKKWEAMR
jgi:hypothetical protein